MAFDSTPLRVEVVSAQGLIWEGDAVQVIARTTEGDIGILANHEPFMGILVPGRGLAPGDLERRGACPQGSLRRRHPPPGGCGRLISMAQTPVSSRASTCGTPSGKSRVR